MIPLRGPHLALRLNARTKNGAETPWKISIPRRVLPLATQRNRWKRRIREVLRQRYEAPLEKVPGTLVIHVQVHTAGAQPPFSELKKELLQLIQKSGVVG